VADKKKSLNQIRKDKQENYDKDVSNITMRDFDKRIKQEQNLNDLIEERIELNKKVLATEEDYNDALASIGKQLGKNSAYTKEFEKQNTQLKAKLAGINDVLKDATTLTKEQIENAEDAAAAYKQGRIGIQSAFAELVKNKDANVDIEQLINEQIKSQKEFANSITDTTQDAADLKKMFDSNVDSLEKMAPALQAAAKDMKNLQKLGDKLGGTAIGGMVNQALGISKSVTGKGPGSIADIAKNMAAKRGAAGLAGAAGAGGGMMGALSGIAAVAGPVALIGAAAMGIFNWVDSGGPQKLAMQAKMLSGDAMLGPDDIRNKAKSLEGTEEFRKVNAKYNYIKPLEERQTREKELFNWSKTNYTSMVEYENSLVKDELSYQIGLKKDAINFGFQQAMQTMEAEAARRKSLFLTGMSQYKKSLIVSERALNAIGSSTDAVLDSIKDIGVSLGVSLSEQIKMGTSAAGMAKMYGSSGEDVLKMGKNFRLMDKSSAKVAFNNVAGVAQFAKMNDMSPAQLFKQMADASEEVMKYSNMTTSQYASQAVLLANMNTSMKDMAVASGTMVLNYKDSIKSEMSLSAMLGKNVNLSEVRARLMSGDMAGGASALKSALGGVDIGSMNAFQKQELSKSTGMGIDQLMELTQSKGGGVKGTLEQQAGLKTGADIAEGALKKDISLAGQRLGMEQAQRKEMMKFEQRERMIMLQLEQAQKLKMLEVEAYWRVKWTKEYEQMQEKDMLTAQHMEHVASGMLMSSASGGGKNLTDQAFRGLEGSVGATKGAELNTMVSSMIKEGRVDSNDMRLAEYYNAQFELAETYKNQPNVLAQKLTETYDKIFAKETQERNKQIQLELAKNTKIADTFAQYTQLYQTQLKSGTALSDSNFVGAREDMRESLKKQYPKLYETFMHEIGKLDYAKLGKEGYSKALAEVETNFKNNLLGSVATPLTAGGSTPAPGDKKAPTLTTGAPAPGDKKTTTVTTPAPAPAPVPPAGKDIYTLVQQGFNQMTTGWNENQKRQDGLLVRTNNAVINGNTQIATLREFKTISWNGYTELLRRADVTNTLLDTLIEATVESATTPITLDGKRLNGALTNVQNRLYGLAKA
jgi:hypothetical protein